MLSMSTLFALLHSKCYYCKSRIFRMHFIFVYFVRGGFRTKIKCTLKFQSKSENLQRSAAVRKFHANERSGSQGYENLVRTKYSGFTVQHLTCFFYWHLFSLLFHVNKVIWDPGILRPPLLYPFEMDPNLLQDFPFSNLQAVKRWAALTGGGFDGLMPSSLSVWNWNELIR